VGGADRREGYITRSAQGVRRVDRARTPGKKLGGREPGFLFLRGNHVAGEPRRSNSQILKFLQVSCHGAHRGGKNLKTLRRGIRP